MTGGMQFVVGDLALDPHAVEAVFERVFCQLVELGDGKDVRFCLGLDGRHFFLSSESRF